MRGKNYERPDSLRPRNLLTKAKALKRAIAMQRHEALSEHITELEQKIEQMKRGTSEDGDAIAFSSEDEDEEEDQESVESEDEDEDEDEYEDEAPDFP